MPLLSVNGHPSVCTNGICASKDGSDICAMFGNPCGKTTVTSAPTTTTAAAPVSQVQCPNPCYLKSALDTIRSQVAGYDVINVSGISGSDCIKQSINHFVL